MDGLSHQCGVLGIGWANYRAGEKNPGIQRTLALGRCSSPARSRCLRLNRSAYAVSVQFATFEKVEYLVCGQCKIFAHCEDYVPIGGLHRETHSYSVLPQYVNGLYNIVCSVCETVHDKFRNDIIAETKELV